MSHYRFMEAEQGEHGVTTLRRVLEIVTDLHHARATANERRLAASRSLLSGRGPSAAATADVEKV